MKPTCDVFRAEDFSEFPSWSEGLAQRANNLLLERATVVYGNEKWEDWHEEDCDGITRTALLINIQPIAKPDTAENLLKELINCWSHENMISIDQFVERARKLLEGK
jgi:hypothetical protein